MAKVDPEVAALRDFRNFLFLVWRHLNLPKPTEVQYDIAEYLQHGPKRCVIEAFRGVGKSWITAAFVCWVLLLDPQKKILVVSASGSRADAFSVFVKKLIMEMPILAHLKPRSDQRDSAIAFDVGPARAAQSPSVKSVGVSGQMAGSRADLIVPDDVETPVNSMTQLLRDRLWEAVKEFDAILKPGGRIVYLGTPQCEMTLYKELHDNRGYSLRVWPARYPRKVDTYGDTLAPLVIKNLETCKPWSPVDSDRFDEVELIEREASYGRSGFALQFMLDTTLSDAERYPLRCSDIPVMSLDPQVGPMRTAWCNMPERELKVPCVGLEGDRWYSPIEGVNTEYIDYTGALLTIDPSGRGTDELAYVVTRFLHGKVFLFESRGLMGGYNEENLQGLADVAKRHKVNLIQIEGNFGDGMFQKLLEPYVNKTYPCSIEEIKNHTQKEKRIIDTLEPVLNQHKLVIDTKVVEEDLKVEKPAYSLFYQMTRITKEKGALRHDDRLDALAMAVGYWVEQMNVDEERAIQEHKDEAFEKQLEEFDAMVERTEVDQLVWN